MDFIDFDSFQDGDDLPQPQPALSLPLASNIENFGKKFSNLNSLTRSLLRNAGGSSKADIDDEENYLQSQAFQIAEKYASMSLNMLKDSDDINSLTVGNGASVGGVDGSTQVSYTKQSSDKNLSTRLSRVLSNPISDLSIREIFLSLEQKISNTTELVEPGVVGSMTRKALRSEIENDLIKTQLMLIREYQPVYKNLSQLEDKLNKLNSIYGDAKTKIELDCENVAQFNQEATDLTTRKQVISLKKNLLSSFRKNFTLSEYEEHLLTNSEINEDFFLALAKAEQIHENCSILLSLDNPKLGLKIMSKMMLHISKSVDRILLFCNKTFGNLHSLNTKDRLTTLHQCLKYLSQKPTYLNSVITGFTESRSKTLVDEFLNQINGNLDQRNDFELDNLQVTESRRNRRRSSASRPIVLSAHDPVRFIGDMLACIHSVVVNEIETIQSIFNENDQVFKSMSSKMVVITLSLLSKPIKSRIEQIISSETKIGTLYSIYNLLDLYTMMLGKQLKPDKETTEEFNNADLIATIGQLSKTSTKKIFSIVRNRLLTVKHSNQAQLDINSSLQPPEWIIEFYSDIIPLLDNITTPTIMNLDEKENEEFMNLVINEPIEIFDEHLKKSNTSNSKTLFDKRDQLILKANFVDLILSKVTPISVLTDKVLQLHSILNEITIKLTEIQAQHYFEGCGLTNYVNIVNMICPFTDDFFDSSIYQPIVENKLFVKEELEKTNLEIQQFLPTALLDIQQSLLRLNSPIIVNDVVTNSSLELVKFYLKFGMLIDEYLKEKLLSWSDLEVATLLGIDSIYNEEKSKLQFEEDI